MRRIGSLIAGLALLSACTATDADPPARPASPAPVASAETGTLAAAGYRIDMPAQWNHALIVYFHGYTITPLELRADEPLASQLRGFVERGYAVAQSAYASTGWAVEQAAADGERLRQYFIGKHGAPRETFAVGLSMGGTLVVQALEASATAYAGGLSLCGAIERTDALLQRDFLLLTAFDFYFPDTLGPLQPVPPAFMPTTAFERKVAAALQSKPRDAESLLRLWGVGDLHTLADVIAFNVYELGELQRRTHGNPLGNADFIYTGSHDDHALNDGVHRYRADPAAAAYLVRWYTPSGVLTRPLLALHDTGDPLVPASGAFDYALAAQRAGHADNFVQQYVNREGHCVFTSEEIDRAFDELIAWVHDGKRPPSGALPAAIAK